MEGKRFDQLARALAASSSRRRVLTGLLAGALGSLRIHATSAQDDGVIIADASGGDDNQATVVEPATAATGGGNDRDDADREEHEQNECKDADCPPNPNEDPPEPGFCCPDGSCSCGGSCDCPDCWVEQLDEGPGGEPLPRDQIVIVQEFCCFKCGGGRDACCDRCNPNTGACETDPDNGPIAGGSIRRR